MLTDKIGDERLRWCREIFDGRFAMHPRQHEAECQSYRASFKFAVRLGSQGASIRPPGVEDEREKRLGCRSMIQGFQMKMTEKEGDIERRITEPSRLGIEDNQAGVGDEQILRAIVSVNERQPHRSESGCLRFEQVPQRRYAFCRAEQVGIDSQLMKVFLRI